MNKVQVLHYSLWHRNYTTAVTQRRARPTKHKVLFCLVPQPLLLVGICLLFDEMTMITHFQIEHFSFIFLPYYVFVLTNTEEWFILCFVIHITFFFFFFVFFFSQREHGRWDWGQEKWKEEKNNENARQKQSRRETQRERQRANARTKHKHIPCNTFAEYIDYITVFLPLYILYIFSPPCVAFHFFFLFFFLLHFFVRYFDSFSLFYYYFECVRVWESRVCRYFVFHLCSTCSISAVQPTPSNVCSGSGCARDIFYFVLYQIFIQHANDEKEHRAAMRWDEIKWELEGRSRIKRKNNIYGKNGSVWCDVLCCGGCYVVCEHFGYFSTL